jgi:hypothetical protein
MMSGNYRLMFGPETQGGVVPEEISQIEISSLTRELEEQR